MQCTLSVVYAFRTLNVPQSFKPNFWLPKISFISLFGCVTLFWRRRFVSVPFGVCVCVLMVDFKTYSDILVRAEKSLESIINNNRDALTQCQYGCPGMAVAATPHPHTIHTERKLIFWLLVLMLLFSCYYVFRLRHLHKVYRLGSSVVGRSFVRSVVCSRCTLYMV